MCPLFCTPGGRAHGNPGQGHPCRQGQGRRRPAGRRSNSCSQPLPDPTGACRGVGQSALRDPTPAVLSPLAYSLLPPHERSTAHHPMARIPKGWTLAGGVLSCSGWGSLQALMQPASENLTSPRCTTSLSHDLQKGTHSPTASVSPIGHCNDQKHME